MDASRPTARLLYLLYCGDLYGTEKMALETASALAPHYDDVVLLAPPGKGSRTLAHGALARPDVRVETFRGRADLLRKLLSLAFGARRVDVLAASVGHSLAGVVVCKLLARRGAHLHVVHGSNQHREGDLRHKRLLNWTPVRIVAVSHFIERLLVAARVRPSKISVIENFLPDAAAAQAPAARPAEHDAPRFRWRVAVVSRAAPIKRLELIVEAARLGLLDDVLVEVYGDGPLLDALRAAASGLPNIVFHGFVADVAHRVAGADALLHTCPFEACALVVLEGFAARVPVVVPDAGGAGELVAHRITGLHFRADDVHSMCASLREALELPDAARQAMIGAAQRDLKQRFVSARGATRYAEALGVAALPTRRRAA
jgi:glycosyltransferase involved in cell wall biosynthesis